MTGLDASVLDALRAARTVRIATSAGPARPVHEAIIWIVVDDAGRALVRSVRGERGRWYRHLRAHPVGVIRLKDSDVPVTAEPAEDRDRIESCSAALRQKYAGSGASLASMLVDEVLETTLELRPD